MAVVDPSENSTLTAWLQRDTTLRRFLRTETSSGALLFAAAIGALIWVNVDASSYNRVWATRLSIHLGGAAVSMDVRGWINSGLMSFYPAYLPDLSLLQTREAIALAWRTRNGRIIDWRRNVELPAHVSSTSVGVHPSTRPYEIINGDGGTYDSKEQPAHDRADDPRRLSPCWQNMRGASGYVDNRPHNQYE